MSDTQRAAKQHRDRLTRAIDNLEKTSVCMDIFDRALREAEQRGMERAAEIIEQASCLDHVQDLAQAIRQAKETT